MGTRGPQPRSPEQMQLEGYRKDRINELAPQPAKGWPEPPAGISRDSLDVWLRLKSNMAGTGHIRQVDGDILRRYCDLVVKANSLQAMYEELGPMVTREEPCKVCDGEEGCPGHGGADPGYYVASYKTNPIALQLRDTLTQLRVFAREIGATPSSRSDITDPGQGKPVQGDFF